MTVDKTNELREALAEYAHEAWSGWMKYQFSLTGSNGPVFSDCTASLEFEQNVIRRWMHQMNTDYADLPEEEKDSDRKEADRMIAIMLKVLLVQREILLEKDMDKKKIKRELYLWISQLIGDALKAMEKSGNFLGLSDPKEIEYVKKLIKAEEARYFDRMRGVFQCGDRCLPDQKEK